VARGEWGPCDCNVATLFVRFAVVSERFLYKIYSGYDGFNPARIADRMLPGDTLRLGWKRYLDSVDAGEEVWIYFHGPGGFEDGVYVRGFVREVDAGNRSVLLRVRDFSTDRPLTDRHTSDRVAQAVATRFQQVFLMPEAWTTAPLCDVESKASSCEAHYCNHCPTWNSLHLIGEEEYKWPSRLPAQLVAYLPAFWVIPRRSFLYWHGGRVAEWIEHTSHLFYRFKTGEATLAYPLALGMHKAISESCEPEFDAIVPVPLSPDKGRAGELHRTRSLSRELGALIKVPIIETLSLRRSISKKNLRVRLGFGPAAFEEAYAASLSVDHRAKALRHVLLVDDVGTDGSTLRCCFEALREESPDCEVVGATAGLMIKRAVVVNENDLRP
jgi:hypothetical protein